MALLTSPRRCPQIGRLAVAAAVSVLACGNPADSDPVGSVAPAPAARLALPEVPVPLLAGNQLRNPDFEVEDFEGWGIGDDRWIGAKQTTQHVLSGERSAELDVIWTSDEREAPVRVFGVAQDISPPRFPDRIGGHYRVEAWENASSETALYLQVVVIVWGDPRSTRLVYGDEPEREIRGYQLRYYLAGVEKPPHEVTNSRQLVVGPATPVLGEWVSFEFPVRRHFEELWGVVPEGYEMLRVFFEARWDNKEEGAPVRAEVYYDDLFFGYDD